MSDSTHNPPAQVPVEIVFTNTDEEVIKAGQYLVMRGQGKTMSEIAAHFGWSSRQSLYNHVAEWERSGALKKAEVLFIQPKAEEIRVATAKILDRYPEILERVANIATGNIKASPRTQLEAADWLFRNVVTPELEKREDPGSSERKYAEKALPLNPTTITLPPSLVKKS